jgi:hypothetical protein
MHLAKGSRMALLAVVVLLFDVSSRGLAQPLSGTYTIGGSSPSYATFGAAATDLAS